MMRRFFPSTIRQGGAVIIPPPLNGYSSVLAASCSRRLYTAYAGALIRVVRDADNVESDIGQDVDGNLDETALTAFWAGGAAGDLLVKNIYGQGGANTGLVQNTKASMGRIMDNTGNIFRNNTRPAVDFFNTLNKFYSLELGGNFIGKFIYSVFKTPTTGVNQIFSHSTINTQFRAEKPGAADRIVRVAAAAETLGNPQILAEIQFTGIAQLISESAVDAQIFWNLDASTVTVHANTSFNLNQVGRRSASGEIFQGVMSEWVITDPLFVSQRTDFVNNTKLYYGIT